MVLVPGSAPQVDIFVTNVPKDTKTSMPAPGSSDVALVSSSRDQGHLVAPDEEDRRRVSMSPTVSDAHNPLLMPNTYDGPTKGRCADGRLKGPDYDYEMGSGGPGVLVHFRGVGQEQVNYLGVHWTGALQD